MTREIPSERLPEGFAHQVDHPPAEPAEPRPAATVVLLREGAEREGEGVEGEGEGAAGEGEGAAGAGLQVLLLRRARTVGFVPGAYVFPGGRVDRADAHPRALARLRGTTPGEAARRLKLAHGDPPAAAYLVAAFRETFEETGILPGVSPEALAGARAVELRQELLDGRTPFHRILDELDAPLDTGAAAYIAHWVTPEAEPRRYDTRFFALAVPRDAEVRVVEGEITRAVWLAPGEALAEHGEGRLPMIFPTLRTLEELAAFSSPREVLAHYRGREVRRILPRLVRTSSGVSIRVPEEEEAP